MSPVRRVAWVLMLALAATASRAVAQTPICTLRGARTTLTSLDVAPADGVAPFQLTVSHVAATVVLDPSGTSRAHVDAALTFDPTTPQRELHPFVTRPLDLAHGVLHLARDEMVIDVRPAGPDVDVHLDPAWRVQIDARLPCDALTLDDLAEGQRMPDTTPRGRTRIAQGPILRVLDAPNGTVSIDLRIEAGADLEFAVFESRGAWLRMQHRFGRDSRIAGWVESAQLVSPSPSGGFGLAGIGAGAGEPPAPTSSEYRGPARVAVGASVFAQPGRGSWATVRDGSHFEVHHVDGDAWVSIYRAPGVARLGDGPTAHAWVAFGTVTFPAGIVRRATHP